MNKGKLIVLVGISGSGKSTFAKEKWEENPLKTLIVNRDKIRELIFGYTEETVSNYYFRNDISKLEKEVTLYEDTLINEGLCQGKTVIVDATHLKKAFLERFKFWNVPTEYKYFEVSVETAIERDSKRNRSVGASVINKQYDQFLQLQREGVPVLDFEPIVFENDVDKPHVWLIDLDGTIAHMNNRSAFDWQKVGEDVVDYSVKKMFKSLDNSNQRVIFCSGRDEVCREETLKWLKHNVSFDMNFTLYMRPEKDQRADWIVKEELWREISKDHYIVGLIDDRNQVCRRARSLELKVYQVEYGNF